MDNSLKKITESETEYKKNGYVERLAYYKKYYISKKKKIKKMQFIHKPIVITFD